MDLKEFLKQKEGWKYKPYEDIGGKLTVGAGNTTNIDPDKTYTNPELDQRLDSDIAVAKEDYTKLVSLETDSKLNENQKNMVQSLLMNVGGTQFKDSQALKELNAGNFDNYLKEASEFRKVKDKVIPGLVNRRKEEAEIFKTVPDKSIEDEQMANSSFEEDSEMFNPTFIKNNKPDIPNFSETLTLLEQSGVSENEINQYKNDQIDMLKFSGVSEKETLEYLGVKNPELNPNVVDPIKKHWGTIAKEWAVGEESDIGKYFWERGFGKSTMNLAAQYHSSGDFGIDAAKALSAEPEDTGHIERWAESIGTISADLLIYLGAGTATSLATKSPYATGFAAGYVNESIKAMYMEALQKDEVGGFKEWWKIYVDHGVKEGIKSGLTLGVAMGLPGTIGAKSTIAKYATQYAAFIGVGSAIEQKMPTKNELINTALVLGTFAGFEGAVKGSKMVLNRVKRTNKSPSEVIGEILIDPKKLEDIASVNIKEFRDKVEAKDAIESFIGPPRPKVEPITEVKPTEIVAQQKETGKPLVEEVAKEKAVEPVEKILEKVPEKKLLERFDKLSEITSKAEKPQETITPELQAMLKNEGGGSEAFSKARGYTEKEIADYKEYMSIAIELDRRFGKDTAITREFDIQTANKEGKSIVSEELGNKSLTRPEEIITEQPLDTSIKGNVAPEILSIKTSEAINSVIENVGTSSPPPRLNMQEFKSRFITQALDKLHPIFVAVREFEKAGGGFKEGYLDPYKTARIQPGMEGRSMHFIRFGTLDFKTLKNNGKSLIKVLEPIKSLKDMKEAIAYFVSKRALEKAEQGKDTGFDLEKANTVVKELGAKWEPVLKEVVDYQTRIMDYLVDSGIIARENANLMLEANRDYVPFYKVLDSTILGAKSTFGNAVKNPFKQFKGGKYKIEDPIQSIYKNTMHHVVMAERNNSFVKFIEMVEALPEAFPNIKKSSKIKATNVEVKEMQEAFDAPIKAEFAEGITVFRREHGIVSEKEIAIFRNGKREVWNVGKDLAEAFKNTNGYQANMLVKFLSVPSRLLRAGATLAPDFMIRNFNRDTVTSAIMSDRGFIPFVHSTMGFWHIIKQDKVYQDWVKSGGMQSTMISMDRNYFQKDVAKYLYGGKVRNQISNPLEMLRITSELFETTSRIGNMKLTYKQLQRQKGSISDRDIAETGGFEGRDLSIDFAKIGTKIQALNMITSFFNARLQGYARLAKAFKENPGKTSFEVFKWITLPSIVLWAVNHDDERYIQLPQWQKDLFWIVITPEIGVGDKIIKDDNDFTIYRIPKPFEPGLLFGTLPERALDWAFNSKGEEFSKFVKDFAFSNLSGLAPIPDFAKPFLESWSNKSLFTTLPIIPYGTEQYAALGLPQYQYNEYTSETSKLLGKTLSEITGGSVGSPARIDSIIQNWTGTLGRYAIQIADAGLKAAGVVDSPEKPGWTLEDLPVIKAFLVRDASGSSEYIQRFYEKDKKAQAIITLKNQLLEEGKGSNLEEVMSEVNLRLLMFEGPSKAMSVIRDAIRKTYLNTDMPAQEKRQQIDGMYQSMIDIARYTLEGYKED
jgi:GH24 family phage-related lysozyme (muramidase)